MFVYRRRPVEGGREGGGGRGGGGVQTAGFRDRFNVGKKEREHVSFRSSRECGDRRGENQTGERGDFNGKAKYQIDKVTNAK